MLRDFCKGAAPEAAGTGWDRRIGSRATGRRGLSPRSSSIAGIAARTTEALAARGTVDVRQRGQDGRVHGVVGFLAGKRS